MVKDTCHTSHVAYMLTQWQLCPELAYLHGGYGFTMPFDGQCACRIVKLRRNRWVDIKPDRGFYL